MTDKSAPNGTADPLEIAMIARHGATTPGWVVPSGAGNMAADSRLETPLDEFDIDYSSDSLEVTIGSGEFFSDGHWGGRDVATPVNLVADSTTTLYAGLGYREVDRIIIGDSSAFPDGHTKQKLWRVKTDSDGVTDVTDLRITNPHEASETRETGHMDLKDLGPGEYADQMLYVPSGQTLKIWEWSYVPNNQQRDRPISIRLIGPDGSTIRREETLHSSGNPIESVSGGNFYRIRIVNEDDNTTFFVGARFVYSISET